MKKKVTALLAGGLVLASFPYYVTSSHANQNPDVEIVESHYYEDIEAFDQLLFDRPVSGNGSWNTTFRSIGSNYGRNFNVYYRNNHPDQARVTLQRRTITGWSNVGAPFTVPGRSELTVTRPAVANSEYRLLIQNLTGANVNGLARVRQL